VPAACAWCSYENTAVPGPDFRFGIAFLKEKERVQNAEPAPFDGAWEAGDTGVYTITYVPTQVSGHASHSAPTPCLTLSAHALPRHGSHSAPTHSHGVHSSHSR
jgi:hypothetical protein